MAVDLEALAHALGIRRVTVVDPYDIEGCRRAVETELQVEEPSLIIARRPCALLKSVKHAPALRVDLDKCTGCKVCLQMCIRDRCRRGWLSYRGRRKWMEMRALKAAGIWQRAAKVGEDLQT